MKRFLILLLATCAGGLLLVLAQAPWSILLGGMIGVAPWVALARHDVPRLQRYAIAYLSGVMFFAVSCHWLVHSSPWNLVMMVPVEAMAIPAFVALVRLIDRVPRVAPALGVAIAWTTVELIRTHYPFNGFPGPLLGYAFDRPRPLAQVADLVGVHGLSFALAWINGVLLEAWGRRSRPGLARWRLPFAVVALLGAMFLYGMGRAADVATRQHPGPTVALVQGNVPQALKSRLLFEEIWGPYHRLTTRLATNHGADEIDLVVWPETMYPDWLNHSSEPKRADKSMRASELERIGQDIVPNALRPLGSSFLMGALTILPDFSGGGRHRQFNSAVLYDPNGVRRGVYSKSVLVPGGEFIPLRAYLPQVVDEWVYEFAHYLPNLSAGPGATAMQLPTRGGKTYRFAPTICYENNYPLYGMNVARLGVDFVVNVSNEAWFKRSAEMDQMEVASRFRAIESRRSLVRATNTGITAVYDATGARSAVLLDAKGEDREIAGVLVATVPIFTGDAFYVRVGDSLEFLIAGLGMFLGLVGLRRRYLASRAS